MNKIQLVILGSRLFSNIINELKFSDILNSNDQFKNIQKKILIIAQPSKIISLIKLLHRRKDYVVCPVGKIIAAGNAYGDLSSGLLRLSRDKKAVDGLYMYIKCVVDNISRSYSTIQSIAAEPWEILVTDHEMDPYVLYLVDQFILLNKQVVFIPEGAQHHNTGTFEFYPYGHYLKPGITKMLISESELNFWKSMNISNELLVTGYMANTLDYNKKLYLTTRLLFFMRQLLTGNSRKKVIFLSLEVFTDLPGFHIGSLTSYQSVKLFVDFLDRVDFSRYTVLAKGKNPVLANALRKRYQKKDILFTSHLSWQIQVLIADMIVFTNSSIGIESIAMGTPAMVWNNTDLPTYADNYFIMESEVVKRVTDKTMINDSLNQLSEVKNGDFTPYNYFFNQDSYHNALAWINNALIQ
jgi:hypothetical protein